MPRRVPLLALAALTAALLSLAIAPGDRSARGEGQDGSATSVAATNGVVVHGVDSKVLAARLREIDQRLVGGDGLAAAKGLASLVTSDLAALVEEGQGVWIAAEEGVLQRTSQLDPESLAAYRRALDPLADAALAKAVARSDASGLTRDAARLAFTTPGPKLLLLLADLRIAQGDLAAAARALEDLLRLLPAHAPPATLAAAASRLSALLAASGDAPGIRGLVRDLAAEVLDVPSSLAEGKTLRDELAQAVSLAERSADGSADARATGVAPGPPGTLRLAAEMALVAERRETGVGPGGRSPGTLLEHPLPIGTADRPALLIRLHNSVRTQSRLVALAPVAADAALPGEPRRVPPFRPLWVWPSSVSEDLRPSVNYPFSPARLGDDLVLFTWPAPPSDDPVHSDRFTDAGEERHELLVLSLSAEGKLVDERGRSAEYESERGDRDAELATLSFCGKPVVDGRAVYATAVRHAAKGDATELHVCRFDFVPEGRGGRLVLRWRRHVLDGPPMPPAIYKARESDELRPDVTLPSEPLVRAGRVFVASNTGAVACLDAASGRPEWVETYERFGPSQRITVRETELESWDDVPLMADGPYLYAAPRDCESLVQFRRAPRGARSARVEEFVFAAPNGTAKQASRLLPNLIPTRMAGVRDGVAYLAGRVAQRPLGATKLEMTEGSPLAAFHLGLGERRALLAQVQEYGSAGAPVLVRGALLFPSPKAIYRVPLDDFEAAPKVLWSHAGGGDTGRGQDRIGTLVPDGERLWTVTPSRVLLFEPVK